MIILIIALIIILKNENNKEDAIAMMNENLKNRLIESEELYLWNSRKN